MPIDPRKFDLASLRLFVSVAEEASLTKAAEREHLVLSAASKRISELEALAGTALLERHPRGVRLTDAGIALLRHARQLLAILHRMAGEVGEHESGLRGQVRLHAIASALTEFLPGDLRAFMRDNPHIKVNLEEEVGPAIVEAVRQGSADVGIVAEQTPVGDLAVRPYRKDRLVLVVSPKHVLARRKAVRLVDVLEYPFVGGHVESSLQTLLVGAANQSGRALNVRVRVRGFDCMAQMIGADLGIGVLPQGAVRAQLKAREVRAVALDEPWAERQLNICVRELRGLPQAALKLLEHLAGS